MSGGNGDLGREAHMKRKPGLIAMFGHMEITLSLLSKVGDVLSVSWKTSVSC